MTLRLSSAQERLRGRFGSFLPAAPPVTGRTRCAFALRMFASGGCEVPHTAVQDIQVRITVDHGFPPSGHASTFGRCAAGGTGEAPRTWLQNCWLVASLCGLALPRAGPQCCDQQKRAAIEPKRHVEGHPEVGLTLRGLEDSNADRGRRNH